MKRRSGVGETRLWFPFRSLCVDDIQRKLGNLPENAPAFKPPAYTPTQDEVEVPKDKAWFDGKTEEELEDIEDDKDLDDDRFLEDYRKKRLMELREAAKVRRYGSVTPISSSDFVREVTQASADVWVVVCLYKDGIAECGLLLGCLEESEAPAFKKAPGGAPANVAVGVSRLGGSSDFIGKVGDDEFGKMLAECLNSNQPTESWLRKYQGLPSRTHPHMQMSFFGGYVLSSIRISTT